MASWLVKATGYARGSVGMAPPREVRKLLGLTLHYRLFWGGFQPLTIISLFISNYLSHRYVAIHAILNVYISIA